MYKLYATNNLQDGGTHFATLQTITSSSSTSCRPQTASGWVHEAREATCRGGPET